LKTVKFRIRDLEDFCEADDRLFKKLWEVQRKVFDSQLKCNSGLYWLLFLLLIANEQHTVANFDSECHLAIEIDTVQSGENIVRPFTLCVMWVVILNGKSVKQVNL
jgi:hypothetical protein